MSDLQERIDALKGNYVFELEKVKIALAEEIVEAMERAKIDDEILAERMGYNRFMLRKILRGTLNPQLTTLAKIAIAVGCQLEVKIR